MLLMLLLLLVLLWWDHFRHWCYRLTTNAAEKGVLFPRAKEFLEGIL